MLSKKKITKEEQSTVPKPSAKKHRTLWAGKVPENKITSGENPSRQANKPKEKKLIFKGMTADASGIIIDTSAGMISKGKEEAKDSDPNEKSNQSSESSKLEQLKSIHKSNRSQFTVFGENTENQIARKIGESAIIQDDSDSESDSSIAKPHSPNKSEESVDSDDEGLFGDVQEDKKQTKPLIIEQPLEVLEQSSEQLSADSAEEEEEEDEEESDEEMEEAAEPAQPLLKPIFVRKEERETILEKEMKEDEERQKLDKQKQKQEEKVKETKELVQKTIEDENKSVESEDDTRMPDDTDYPEKELEEYEKWKQREFERIKRDLEEREQNENEKVEVERRRLLTDEERELENKRLGSDKTDHKEGRKYSFMQKYYKLGPYYMDTAKKGGKYDILNRDYNAPLASEKRDVSALPMCMQKRRGEFGMRGQSKWTHLTNEDTTNFDPQWKVPENVFKRTQQKLGGYKGAYNFDNPLKRSKHH